MGHPRQRRSFHTGLRLLLGGIFIWASWDKIRAPAAFAEIIANYQLLPEAAIPVVSVWLPWVEAMCGLCLVTGVGAAGAALLVNLLLVGFIAALSLNLARGIDVNCGCFSLAAAAPGSVPLEIARDAVLLAVGIVVLKSQIRKGTPPDARSEASPAPERERWDQPPES